MAEKSSLLDNSSAQMDITRFKTAMLEMNWVWAQETVPAKNAYVRFRHTFELSDADAAAALSITADSRYWVWVNDTYVGFGPPRAWPERWFLDKYSLSGKLQAGVNVISVLVQHFGEGNFQYIPHAPGLAASVLFDGAERVLGACDWKASLDPALRVHVPRVSVQEWYEEQYDGRLYDGWRETCYDDSAWQVAADQPPAKRKLVPRDIPHLTREPVDVVEVVEAGELGETGQVWTFDLKPYLAPDDRSSNALIYSAMLYSEVISPIAQEVEMVRAHRHDAPVKLNGLVVGAVDSSEHMGMWTDVMTQRLKLRAGRNTLLIPVPGLLKTPDGELPGGIAHMAQVTFEFRGGEGLSFRATDRSDTAWALLGPFELGGLEEGIDHPFLLESAVRASSFNGGREELARVWAEGSLAAGDKGANWFRALPAEIAMENDVFARLIRPLYGPRPEERAPWLAAGEVTFPVEIPCVAAAGVKILFDFGREWVGPQWFRLDAPEGTVVEVLNFEFIQQDGRHNHAVGMNNSFGYTCREGEQAFESLQRRGFRYAWLVVRNYLRPVRLLGFGAIFSTYPFREVGGFRCDDTALNHIWSVGAHTLRCCAEDTYTDCPTYEQAHWVGDARVEGLVDWVINGDGRLWKHCLEQAGESLRRYPITASHVPSAWDNILPAWSFLWMRSCYEYMLYTGDRAGAETLFAWVERNVEGALGFLNERGLFEIKAWNMFDWAEMDTPRDGIVTHQNCFFVQGLAECAKLAEWIGRNDAAERYREIAKDLAENINRYLWSEPMGAYLDCIRADGRPSEVFSQQTQAAAYCTGVASGERKALCRGYMTQVPESFVRAGSPFFEFFLLEVLASEGDWQSVLEIIKRDWGFMIEQGATTFWEMWSLTSGRLTRSHCHGWSSAPTFFLSMGLAGVSPLEPGFAAIRCCPPDVPLEEIHVKIPTPHGLIRVDRVRTPGGWSNELVVPEGVRVVEDLASK